MLRPEFPADATTRDVAAAAIALETDKEKSGPSRLRLMTWAPFEAAYAIASATEAVVPAPSALSTRRDIKLTSHETPVTPCPSLPEAPTVPATWVPCPT